MPSTAAGFFGKLPSAGDFVQRRLPASFVDTWDGHFETAVARSRQALGDAWHEAFHASPVWRFVLAAGVCGETAWAGVMGPGADRVGRCFPMVIAAALPSDSGVTAIRDGATWFDRAEQLHRAAQADAGVGVDHFDEQVAALSGPLDGDQSQQPDPLREVDWAAASHWRLPLPAHGGAATTLADLWTRLASMPGRWCLWWTDGAGRVPASVLVTDGLPQAEAYAGLLDAEQATAAWHTPGGFDDLVLHAPAPPAANALPPSIPGDSWLPDDFDLLADLDGPPPAVPAVAPLAEAGIAVTDALAPVATAQVEPVAGLAVLQRAEVGLSLVATEVGAADPRQQAVAAVAAIAGDMLGAELIGGMQVLRTRIMALNPQLRQFGEDLVDPVPEDCAVIAAHVAGGQATLLRIGAAAAWHWRHGRLQPFFARSDAPPAATSGSDSSDDLDDLLFSTVSLAAPGLGATAQPTCGEVSCAIQAGDRLLLMASHPLLQLPPELLARSLAAGSCADARARIATAAGLAAEPDHWPLAIVEVQA